MQVVNLQFLVKGGLQHTVFLITRVGNMWQVIFSFFLRKFWLACTNQKHRKHLIPPPPPPKKRILLNFSVSPFVSPGPFWFSLSHSVSHPISEFSTSKSDVPCFFFPRLLLLPSIFPCPLSPSFSSSPVSVFLCLFMLCSLCWSLFTSVLMCFLVHVFFFFSFFFGESSSSADFCFSSDWSCSASFVFLAFLVLLCFFLLLLFFSFFFFFFFFFFFLFFVLVLSLLLLLLCLEEQTAMVRFSWLLWCVFGCSFFWDRPSRMDLRRKNGKSCTLIFWHFFIKDTFPKKPSASCVWGFLSAVLLHKRVFLRFVLEPVKRKWTRQNATKIGISGHQPGGPVMGFYSFGFSGGCACASKYTYGVLGLFLSNPA